MASTACWNIRGCEGDENNYDHCPHAMLGGRCAVDCRFAQCDRSYHKVVTDPLMLLDPTVDRQACIKEVCCMCEFYLKNGPKINA